MGCAALRSRRFRPASMGIRCRMPPKLPPLQSRTSCRRRQTPSSESCSSASMRQPARSTRQRSAVDGGCEVDTVGREARPMMIPESFHSASDDLPWADDWAGDPGIKLKLLMADVEGGRYAVRMLFAPGVEIGRAHV